MGARTRQQTGPELVFLPVPAVAVGSTELPLTQRNQTAEWAASWLRREQSSGPD